MNATTLDQDIAALLARWQSRAFAWGSSDCCQFARDAAQALHGIGFDAPAYRSERGALRVLRALGGYGGIMRAINFAERPLIAAARGDFVIFKSAAPGSFEHGLAVVAGVQAYAPAAAGLVPVERPAWLQCFGPKGGA